MKMANLNICLLDFSGDINAQLCTLCKLTKTEAAYVANTIRTFDASPLPQDRAGFKMKSLLSSL